MIYCLHRSNPAAGGDKMIALTLPEIDAMDDTMRCEPLRGERLTIKPQSLGELRLEHYRRSADAYQVRCTLGMGYSVDRRQS